MSREVYCAVCGVTFCSPFEAHQDQVDAEYNMKLFDHEDLDWLQHAVVLREEPMRYEDTATGRALFKRKVRLEFHKVVQSAPGQVYREEPSLRALQAGIHDTSVTIHSACFKILKRVIGDEYWDVDAVHYTFQLLLPENKFPWYLLDYGDVAELQGQHWEYRKGTEEFVFNPIWVPHIGRYCLRLPLLDSTDPTSATRFRRSDPFNRLPVEILTMIVANLDRASVESLQTASGGRMARLDLNSFWRRRLLEDMPWLFDFPRKKMRDARSQDTDWAKVYRQLDLAGTTSHPSKWHGLVNRKRIWGLCQTFAAVCMTRDEEQGE